MRSNRPILLADVGRRTRRRIMVIHLMESLYDRVVTFVAKRLGVRADRITPTTTIFGDLHTDGDDGVELLADFGREFAVDMSGCDPSRCFGPDGFYPWAPIYWIVLAFRKRSPEDRARLKPLRIADLVRSAECGRWAGG